MKKIYINIEIITVVKKQTEIFLNKLRRINIMISNHVFGTVFPQINNMKLKNVKNGQGSYEPGI